MEHVYTYSITNQLPVDADITNSYPGISLITISEDDWSRERQTNSDLCFVQNYTGNSLLLEQNYVADVSIKSMGGKMSVMDQGSMHLIVLFDSTTDFISVDITNWVGGQIKDDAHRSHGVIEIFDSNSNRIKTISSKLLQLGEVDTITWKLESESENIKYLNIYGSIGTGYGSEDYAIYIEQLRYNNFSSNSVKAPTNLKIKT